MKDSTLKKAMSLMGRKGGRKTSPAKAAASRRNGRKGGKPRTLPGPQSGVA